jgi:RNA polymerase-binding transcription factor DksA
MNAHHRDKKRRHFVLTPEQLAKLRTMIDDRYEALSAEIHQDAARSRDETYGELAGPVTDGGDKATADLISDLDSAELDRDLAELRQFEAAREKLAGGSYGICVDCGEKIDFERLLTQPAALRCVDCQQVHERTYTHPPEPKL